MAQLYNVIMAQLVTRRDASGLLPHRQVAADTHSSFVPVRGRYIDFVLFGEGDGFQCFGLLFEIVCLCEMKSIEPVVRSEPFTLNGTVSVSDSM